MKSKWLKTTLKVAFSLIALYVLLVCLEILHHWWFYHYRPLPNIRVVGGPLNTFAQGLNKFKRDVRRYPTSEEGLMALLEKPNNLPAWNGPYIPFTKHYLLDPWKNPFIYLPTKDIYMLISYGADGKPGGEGENEDIIFVPNVKKLE